MEPRCLRHCSFCDHGLLRGGDAALLRRHQAAVRDGATSAVHPRPRRRLSHAGVATFDIVDGFAADLTVTKSRALRATPPTCAGSSRSSSATPSRRSPQLRPAADHSVRRHRRPRAATRGPRRSGEVNVVVIDTGVDNNHPELQGRSTPAATTSSTNDRRSDGRRRPRHPRRRHHRRRQQRLGVVGVAPDVRLWALKVLDSDGKRHDGRRRQGPRLGRRRRKKPTAATGSSTSPLGGPQSTAPRARRSRA